MKRFKFFAMLFMALMTCATFSACSDDDDDEGGGKTSSSSLKGRTFQSEYTGVDGDGNPESWSTTLYFKSTTECSVTSKGYWYIWYNNGYKRESWNETKTCSYSVSGEKITLHNYPFYNSGNLVLTYNGSYLTGGGDTFYEK